MRIIIAIFLLLAAPAYAQRINDTQAPERSSTIEKIRDGYKRIHTIQEPPTYTPHQLAMLYFRGATPGTPPTATTITSVTASPATGTLTIGQSTTITLHFSGSVTVASGTPTIGLATSPSTASASYTSGSGTTLLNFNYTVGSNQNAAPLILAASGAVVLNGATIKDGSNNSAVLSGANGASLTPLNVDTSSPGACVGTQYYVSAAGNDSNNGTSTSTPWASIAKVNTGPAGRFVAGNCVNFRANDNFAGCLIMSTGTNIGSTSGGNPIYVQSYGAGNATITSNANCPLSGNGKTGAIRIDGGGAALTGLVLQNLNVRNGTTTPNGVVIQSSGNATSSAITVQNMDVMGFSTPNNNPFTGAEISLLGSPNVPAGCGSLTNISILGNNLHGATSASADSTGVAIGGLCGTVSVVRIAGNHIYNMGGVANDQAGAIGIDGQDSPAHATDIVAEYNLIHDIAGNTTSCGGMSGIETANAQRITIRYNEIYNVKPLNANQAQPVGPGCDWDGIDLDGSTQASIVEYNYTHSNWGGGLLGWMGLGGSGAAWGPASAPNTYRYNISENDSPSTKADTEGAVKMTNTGATNPIVYVYGNTVYQGNSSASAAHNAFSVTKNGGGTAFGSGSVFANNILIATAGNHLSICNSSSFANLTFKSNGYYTPGGSFQMGASGCTGGPWNSLAAWQAVAVGGDTGATTANPNFAGTVPVGNCTWTPSALTGPQPCPTSYKLTPSSTAYKGTGTNLLSLGINMGSSDYYNNSIPNSTGTGYNIGADGEASLTTVGPRVAVGPQSTVACPGGSVSISPGTTIQTIVNANSAGTSYCLASGTFTSQSVVPKTGDRFTGAVGTTMDGSGTTANAFSGSATGVTVQNIVITNYKPGVQRAVIGKTDGTGVDNWTLRNLEVKNSVGTSMSAGCSSCGATGIAFQSGSTVVANYIHDHPSLGFSCYGPNDIVTDNEIARNNPWSVGVQPQVDPGWEAGGNKCWGATGETVSYNYSHDNGGPGLWFDSPGSGTWNNNANISNNLVTGNYYNGIMWEVSKNAVISYNSTSNNGGAVGTPWTRTGSISCATNWLWCAEILSSSSSATDSGTLIDIHHNTLVSSTNGATVSILSQARGDSPGNARNVHVYNNTVTMTSNSSFGLDADAGAYADNNYFHCDSFTGGQSNFFWNGGGQNLASFQGNGQENNGGCASVGAGS